MVFDRDMALAGRVGTLKVREKAGLGAVSTLSEEDGAFVIRVDRDAPLAAKAFGLVYQLVQLADIASMATGSVAPMVSPGWIQDRTPAILLLLAGLDLLNPELGITVEGIMKEAGPPFVGEARG